MQPVENVERIRIPKVAEVVANTLRRKIVTGQYEIGELLPPEGTLMSTFDVARTTIRDAFRILETEGLLEVRRGGGGGGRVPGAVHGDGGRLRRAAPPVREDDCGGRPHRSEADRGPCRGLLARTADEGALASLRSLLADEAAAGDEALLIKAEGRFHRAVVDLAGNRVVSLLSAVAGRLIAEQIARASGPARSVEPAAGRQARSRVREGAPRPRPAGQADRSRRPRRRGGAVAAPPRCRHRRARPAATSGPIGPRPAALTLPTADRPVRA